MNYWDHISTLSEDEVKEAILAGYKDGKPFVPDVLHSTWPPGLRSILDFGCGLGRNWKMLLTHATTVYAHDRPAMMLRFLNVQLPNGIVPAPTLKIGYVDLVYMSLVLQHIPLNDVQVLFDELPNHHYLLVHGRARHDERGNTFSCVPQIRYRPLEVIALAPTRYLTVLDRAFERDESDQHYEVLYATRREGE